MIYITEEDVRRLLSMDRAIKSIEKAFHELGTGSGNNIPRSRVQLPNQTLHVMSAGSTELNYTGLKAYTTTQSGAQFLVILFQGNSGDPVAIIEADLLGQIRTGAASGIATKYLANEEATTVGIIGTGWQARSQLEAGSKVRAITLAKAYGRDKNRREKFCLEMTEKLGLPVKPVDNPMDCITFAEIVITITSSECPVLQGAWLRPGAHVNAAGSNSVQRREIDLEAVKKSNVVVVDSKDQAKLESGDLLEPIKQGALSWESVSELAAVIVGDVPGRVNTTDITLFESQGIAMEDVAVASLVYEQAKVQNIGQKIG